MVCGGMLYCVVCSGVVGSIVMWFVARWAVLLCAVW